MAEEIAEPSTAEPMRYHKDEVTRGRHCWGRDEASFVQQDGEWVGKCPCSMTEASAQALLDEAFFEAPSSGYPKKAWALDSEGRIYVAFESGKQSGIYHGCPERKEWFEDGARTPAYIRRDLLTRAKDLGLDVKMKKWLRSQPERES